jgi:hypothetical protein
MNHETIANRKAQDAINYIALAPRLQPVAGQPEYQFSRLKR